MTDKSSYLTLKLTPELRDMIDRAVRANEIWMTRANMSSDELRMAGVDPNRAMEAAHDDMRAAQARIGAYVLRILGKG